MRVLITGVDGYLGWSLATYLIARGYEVAGVDNFYRRRWVNEMKSWSAIPIALMEERLKAIQDHFNKKVRFWRGDLRDYDFVKSVFQEFQPEAIIHFAECPSAAYSLIDVDHAVFVQTNNITTTFNVLFAMKEIVPNAHLIKLGTMGEYGTPNLDIPEGFFEVEFKGRKDKLPFPRQAGSWYHWSKVHGSNNIMFACDLWGLRATDVMQGVVFGTQIDEFGDDLRLSTRVDFDQAFGTIINRFCCQAVINHPITIYGSGEQKRGIIPLRDSMQCLTIALENPPKKGEYRVFNQFEKVYTLNEIAERVEKSATSLGLRVKIQYTSNPRKELEQHYYEPSNDTLLKLGYKPTIDIEKELELMMQVLSKYSDRIQEKRNVLIPDIHWTGEKSKVDLL